jgi:hypothetical protein
MNTNMQRAIVAAAIFAALSVPALAQQPKTITFTLAVGEANTVMNAVAEKPWKDVNPLLQKMVAQLNAQLAPPAPTPPVAPTEPSATPPEKP